MSDLIRPLGEYLSLLEQEGLLADPVPDSLDRSAPVQAVRDGIGQKALLLQQGQIFAQRADEIRHTGIPPKGQGMGRVICCGSDAGACGRPVPPAPPERPLRL